MQRCPLRRPDRLIGLLAVATMLQACAHVGVKPTTDEDWFDRANRSALDTDDPSIYTETFLRTHDLEEDFEDRPMELLIELDRIACERQSRDIGFVLAELCYLIGKRQRDAETAARLHTTSAAYAYAVLFDERFDTEPMAFDPRFRMACEFYNRSAATMLAYARESGRNTGPVVVLPMLRGEARIARGASELPWEAGSFKAFIPTYRFAVEGLENHYRQYGIGVPLIAVRDTEWFTETRLAAHDQFIPRFDLAFAATLVIRVGGSVFDRTDESPDLEAVGDLYDPMRNDTTEIAGRTVPLEFDLTTPLAYTLANMPELSGMQGMLNVEAWDEERGLHMLAPYTPGKIPVVFVHGLMSSPTTWMPMFNELLANDTIRENYQFWFFQYPTGNPIFYSAAVLRRTLLETRAILDPDARDPAFDHVVVVGHSMGGIISKTAVQPSGLELWKAVIRRPHEEALDTLDPETRELLREVFFFEPVPGVERVVFISTPHRGSEMATGLIGWFGASLVKLPGRLVERTEGLIQLLKADDPEAGDQKIGTGIDGLRPQNPVLQASAAITIDERVTFHSIHGNNEAEGVPDGTDGIVPYWSSYLEGAESDLIVESGHSAHKHPLAILDIERILLLHLAEIEQAE